MGQLRNVQDCVARALHLRDLENNKKLINRLIGPQTGAGAF